MLDPKNGKDFQQLPPVSPGFMNRVEQLINRLYTFYKPYIRSPAAPDSTIIASTIGRIPNIALLIYRLLQDETKQTIWQAIKI